LPQVNIQAQRKICSLFITRTIYRFFRAAWRIPKDFLRLEELLCLPTSRNKKLAPAPFLAGANWPLGPFHLVLHKVLALCFSQVEGWLRFHETTT
jgi:hypothetical protein